MSDTADEKNAGTDLETMPVKDALKQLGADPDKGLTAAEAASRLQQYGPNALVEHETSMAARILGYFTGPIAFMIEPSAVSRPRKAASAPSRSPASNSVRAVR